MNNDADKCVVIRLVITEVFAQLAHFDVSRVRKNSVNSLGYPRYTQRTALSS